MGKRLCFQLLQNRPDVELDVFFRDSADTLAGFLYSQIGKIPVIHEKVEAEGWVFEIQELSGRRIQRVKASRVPETPQTEEEVKDDKQ